MRKQTGRLKMASVRFLLGFCLHGASVWVEDHCCSVKVSSWSANGEFNCRAEMVWLRVVYAATGDVWLIDCCYCWINV